MPNCSWQRRLINDVERDDGEFLVHHNPLVHVEHEDVYIKHRTAVIYHLNNKVLVTHISVWIRINLILGPELIKAPDYQVRT